MPSFSIHDPDQLNVYAALFSLLKNWSTSIIIHCTPEGLRIQTMDKSHVCLAEIRFEPSWFHQFDCSDYTDICVNTSKMDTIISHCLKNHSCIQFEFDNESPDIIHIHLSNDLSNDLSNEADADGKVEQISEEESKGEVAPVALPVAPPVVSEEPPKKKAKKETKKEKAAREAAESAATAISTAEKATIASAISAAEKASDKKADKKTKGKEKPVVTGYRYHYELNLDTIDEADLEIPEVEYDVEFGIDAKKLTEVLGQLAIFGESVQFTCTEENILLQAHGENGTLKVEVGVDDLEEYSLSEGVKTDVMFSLNNLSKLCITSKLSNQVNIQLSNDYPMLIRYGMNHGSSAVFFIAPKIND